MKKTICIIIGILLWSASSLNLKAQNPNFIGGVLLNLNGIQIEGEKEQYWDSSNGTIWGTGGISAGIFVKRDLTEKVYGVMELRYIQKGSLYEFADQNGSRALESLRLDYMELPVLVGFKFMRKRKPIFFEAGLAYSRLFKPEMRFKKLVERVKTPNVDNFKNNDFSIVADLKLALTRKDNLLLGFRTEYSLFPIHKNYKLHNLDYGVELNYLFGGNPLQ